MLGLERVPDEYIIVLFGKGLLMKFTIDVEATNRCNARCRFCPREQTPHQGLMSAEVFAQALTRAVEFRDVACSLFSDPEVTVTLCGLGEPLMNRRTPSFVRMIREAGFKCAMSSNGSFLNERTGQKLLDAGLQRIFINAGDLEDAYERVYALPFKRTRDNIARFVVMAGDRCKVIIVIVGHNLDPERVRAVESYWRDLGVTSFEHHELINRGGSLLVDGMQFANHPYLKRANELLRDRGISPICGVAFRFLFVGYDGQYYLCSSDWEKKAPLGNVFDESFASVTMDKLQHVATREPICRTCCHDPVNRLAESLRTIAEGDEDSPMTRQALVESVAASDSQVRAIAEEFVSLRTR
jgi:MoaA/NifB/PqqE/SkfB family radical SAM enzyme